MILVDSSIWIDFLNTTHSAYREYLKQLIRDRNQACICGVILQEVLQGIRAEREQHQISYYLLRFPFLPTSKSIYISAASIYRNLRRKGITIPSVDATIAAIAIEYGVPLFTLDKHFELIVSVTQLKLYQA